MNAPGYWMHETSGVLRPAVHAYLYRRPMSDDQINAMRAYLRQWINAPTWQGPDIDSLRADVEGLTTRAAISSWLRRAEHAGIDPL
jgi:hypothetical protein